MSLIETMANVASEEVKRREVGLVYGKVMSINPLQIKVGDKMVLTSDFLILSQLVVKNATWRDLIVGDTVRMLKLNGGQIYYVLEREGAL